MKLAHIRGATPYALTCLALSLATAGSIHSHARPEALDEVTLQKAAPPSEVAVALAVQGRASLLKTIRRLIDLRPRWTENLLQNGDFEGPYVPAGNDDECPVGWTYDESRPHENTRTLHVEDNGPSRPGTTAFDFHRSNGGTSGDHTQIVHPMNLRADRYQALRLSLDVKVYSHNLVAGGWATPAFEWPVRVEIRFVDQTGTSQVYRRGWYVNPPGDGSRVNDPGSGSIPIYHDVLVTPGTWSTHTLDLLAELPAVRRITSVRVGGAGWDFHGRADNVVLRGYGRAVARP